MQCIHDLRPESIYSNEILQSKCALILLRTTFGSIFDVLFYGSIICALSVAASIMHDRAISRNARSKGIDNCCGLYIRVYFRITPIENERRFINLITI